MYYSVLVVTIDLEWHEMCIAYLLSSDLRDGDDREGRVMLWKIGDVEMLRYCRELRKYMTLIVYCDNEMNCGWEVEYGEWDRYGYGEVCMTLRYICTIARW